MRVQFSYTNTDVETVKYIFNEWYEFKVTRKNEVKWLFE